MCMEKGKMVKCFIIFSIHITTSRNPGRLGFADGLSALLMPLDRPSIGRWMFANANMADRLLSDRIRYAT